MENKYPLLGATPVNSGTGQPAASSSLGVGSDPMDMGSLSLDPNNLPQQPPLSARPPDRNDASLISRILKRADVVLVVLLVVGLGALIATSLRKHPAQQANSNSIAGQYGTIQIPLSAFIANEQAVGFGKNSVVINGALTLNSSLVITPSVQPNTPTAGQLYFDRNTSQMAYYNGVTFVPLTSTSQVMQSLGGLSGQVTLGGGLSAVGNQLSNAGVLSFGGRTGAVTIGSGLAMNGNAVQNAGVISLVPGTGNLQIVNDGAGNLTISSVGGGAGTVTSPGGTTGRLALFNGAQDIGDSIVSQSGTVVTVTGDLNISGQLTLGTALSVANGGTGATSLNSNGVLVGNGVGAISAVTAAGPGLCLVSTGGAPAFAACTGSTGVTMLDGLTGALTLANSSGLGTVVTIDDATTAAKGIARFNATNFTAVGGVVNAIQNINSAATPTFAGVNTNNITPSAAFTLGALGQAFTLRGTDTSVITATNGANTTTLSFQTPGANTTYRFAAAVGGSFDVCTTFGNCVGLGGGVTGGGTNNRLVKFTSTGSTVGDSSITDTAGVVTTTGDLVIQGGDATIGVSNSQTGTLNFAHASSAFLGSIVQGTLTANRTYTLPDAAGTVCLNTGNCLGGGGGGANTALSNLISVAINTTLLPGAAGTINLGSGALPFGDVFLAGTSGTPVTNNFRITGVSTGGLRTITLPDASGTVCLQAVAACGFATGTGAAFVQNGNSFGATGTLGTNDDNDLAFERNNSVRMTITNDNLVFASGGFGFGLNIQQGAITQGYNGASYGYDLGMSNSQVSGIRVAHNGGGTTTNGLEVANLAGAITNGLAFTGAIGTDINRSSGTLTLNGGNGITASVGGSSVISATSTAVTLGTNVDLLLQGVTAYISNPQTQTNSEAFGLGATAAGSNALAVGQGSFSKASGVSLGQAAGASSGDFGGPVSVGQNANANAWGVAIGQNASGSGNFGVAIGNSTTSAQESISVGANANSNLRGVALGYGATTGGNDRIVIGHNAAATADGQMVVGSGDSAIGQVIIGSGVTNATPVGFTLQGTGGSGTNVAGASVAIAGGAGTGNANGGNLAFKVATPGVSGGAANVPVAVETLSGVNGSALFQNTANSTAGFQVQNAGGLAILSVDTTSNLLSILGPGTNGSNSRINFGNDGKLSITGGNGTNNNGLTFMAYARLFVTNTNGDSSMSIDTQNGITSFSSTPGHDANGGLLVTQSNSNDVFFVGTAGSEGYVKVGYTGDNNATPFILDNDATSDPTGTNGAMYYNTSLGKFRCFESSAWKDCIAPGSGGFVQGGNLFGAAGNLGTNDNFDLNIRTNGLTRLTIKNDGSAINLASNTNLNLQGATASISNPQGSTNGEAFGSGATVAGTNRGTAVGNGASVTNNDSVAIGFNATAPNASVVVGSSSSCTNNSCVAIGSATSVAYSSVGIGSGVSITQNEAVAIGSGAGTNSFGAIAIGSSTLANNVRSIAIGHGATTTADNQLVIGGASLAANNITNVVIGSGVTDATPVGFTLQATSGAGTNITGASLTIAGGQSTGNANGGNVTFQVSAPGSSGGSTNSLATIATFSGANGSLRLQNSVDSTTGFNIQTQGGGNVFTVDTVNSRAGINLGGSNVPSISGVGLQVKGAIGITGNTSSGLLNNYVTPGGATVAARFTIENDSLGGNNAMLYAGLKSTSADNSRVFAALDARTTTHHDPTIAVFSVDENKLFGLTWAGGSAVARLTTGDTPVSSGFGSAGVQVQSGDVLGTSATTGDVFIKSGDASSGTNSSSGNTVIDVGSKSGSGTVGVVNLGVTNASAINIGHSGMTTTVNGALTVTSILSADSVTDIVRVGPLAGDTTGPLLVLGNKTNSGDPGVVDGAMYYNSNIKSFRCGVDGVWVSCIGGLLSSSTAIASTVANTASETAFSSSATIPANYCQSGRMLRLTANGLYGTSGTPTITLRVKLGGVTLATSDAPAWFGGETGMGWYMTTTVMCPNAPANPATVTGQGVLTMGGEANRQLPYNSTATVNTTASNNLTITAQWAGVGATNTITLDSFAVEGLGP